MGDNPDIKVEIGAHTDPRGSMKANDVLSQKRAESVVKQLVKNGVSPTRLQAKGYGERVPYVLKEEILGMKKGSALTDIFISKLTNKTAQNRAYQLDRRTEFKIVGFVKGVDLEKGIELIEEVVPEEEAPQEQLIIKKHVQPKEGE